MKAYLGETILVHPTVVGETVWYTRKEHDEAEVEAWALYHVHRSDESEITKSYLVEAIIGSRR